MKQTPLFQLDSPPALPTGFHYRENFISVGEEQELLDTIQRLPFQNAKYQQYTARRRIVSYGSGYDYARNARTPAPELPDFLESLRSRAAQWIGATPDVFVQALVAEYQPGTPLGWHRDVPDYESIVAVSLLASCRIRFRRYPWNPEQKADIFAIEPQPRSAYVLSRDIRWKWQHSVPAVKALRYSITLRTARERQQ